MDKKVLRMRYNVFMLGSDLICVADLPLDLSSGESRVQL
jgi:hypothetical protein